MMSPYRVPKGIPIFIPLLNLQTEVEVWGTDAREFNPARWLAKDEDGSGLTIPEGAREMPSLAFPTFLAGARGCIGFRFTLIE